MTDPKTIDITTGNELFRRADPVGLLPEVSAKSYVNELRQRLGERFPRARIFVRWAPSRTDDPDIYTFPRAEDAEEQIAGLVQELREDGDAWLRYDEAVRSAFA